MCLSKSVAIALLPLFDRYSEYSKNLIAEGIDDFCLRIKHLESFANTGEELAFSRRISAEIARRAFWSDCILSTGGFERESSLAPFCGDWLDLLLDEHRKTLREGGEVEKAKYLSAMDIDPCRTRKKEWLNENFQNWRIENVELIELQLRHRDEMVASGVVQTRPVEDEAESIMGFVETQMLEGLRDASYKRIKRGDRKRVVLAKRLSDDLEFRFQIDSYVWSFSEFGSRRLGTHQEERYFDPNCLHLSLGLHLRSSLTRRFSDTPEITIPFFHLAPLSVYGKYRNASHISVAIAGWTALYRMAAKEIEDACLACEEK